MLSHEHRIPDVYGKRDFASILHIIPPDCIGKRRGSQGRHASFSLK